MDPGTVTTSDPSSAAPRLERRRRFRHRLHSPVYASFKSPQAGMVVDLSELLDLSEDGFAVHTPEPLEAERPLALTLDLPETGAYLHGHGVAVWSDVSGRGGVRFSDLSETSRSLLKEWLFSNLLVAAANHAARADQVARKERQEPIPEQALPGAAAMATDSTVLDAPVVIDAPVIHAPAIDAKPAETIPLPEQLPAIKSISEQVRALDHDPAAVLQLVTNCACEWTGASGAALALITGDAMICRARSGETAPPLGVSVDVEHGLSGECVRTAQTVISEDTENDPRVDVEACRALGIGSILAVPIFGMQTSGLQTSAGYRVAGLLEVFAPAPRAFNKDHAALLWQLVESVPVQPVTSPEAVTATAGELTAPTTVAPAIPRSEKSSEERTPAAGQHVSANATEPVAEAVREPVSSLTARLIRLTKGGLPRTLYLAMMAVVAVGATGAGYLLAPTIQSRWMGATGRSTASAAAPTTASRATVSNSPEELRQLADSGDAEAQYWIGIRYGTGANVAQNEAEAAKWFQRAAQQGHVQAQARLASYYWSGRGVPKDLSTAYFWAALAWAQGDENSKMLLEGLSSQMTRAQVLTARQQADNWLHQHNQQATARK